MVVIFFDPSGQSLPWNPVSDVHRICRSAPSLGALDEADRHDEVEGGGWPVPDITTEVFEKMMILHQGFSKAETLSEQTFIRGIFYKTFVSLQVCRRYCESVKTAGPNFSFCNFVVNSPIQWEVRRVMVSMRNPHTGRTLPPTFSDSAPWWRIRSGSGSSMQMASGQVSW